MQNTRRRIYDKNFYFVSLLWNINSNMNRVNFDYNEHNRTDMFSSLKHVSKPDHVLNKNVS